MTHRGMAEARPDTPKKYTCACGFAQEDRKSKFLGKCRHCNTRAKYLRGQSSFDSGSAARGWTPNTNANNISNTASGSPSGSTGSSPNNSSSSSSSNSSTASASNSDGDGSNSSSISSRSSSSGGGGGGGGGSGAGSGGGGGDANGDGDGSNSAATGTTATTGASANNRLVRQVSVAETRRRSRSMDRYDAYRITDPPPYSWVAPGRSRGREGGRELTRGRGGGAAPVRRAESEDSARGTRASELQTPPPPYEVAQRQSYYQFPPSYEEALASSMSRVRISSSPSAASATRDSQTSPNPAAARSLLPTSVTSPVALLPMTSPRSSRVLEEQAAVLEAQREAQVEAQRRAQREAQREAQLERERDMERQRLRELQLAQYCGCAKCQSLYYSYYYDDPMNDGGAFPMETQVLMQEVLTDGLAFCSIM